MPESPHKDQQSPKGIPGKQGDVLHVFHYDRTTGRAKRAGIIPVPPPSGTATPQALPVQALVPFGPPIPQNFPPTNTTPMSWPRDLAVTRDGKTLLAALNLADRAAIVDTKTKDARYVKVGSYPYRAAITRDGKGLVSNESDGTVSVLNLKDGTKVADIQVGAHLSHPEGIAADPKADRAFVAVANQDRVVEIDTKAMTVRHALSLERPEGVGSSPTQVSVDAKGCYLTVAQSGEDDVVVYALRSGCPKPKAAPRKKRRTHSKTRGKQGKRKGDQTSALRSASTPGDAAAAPVATKVLVWVSVGGERVGSVRRH